MIVHRDYRSAAESTIKIFQDHILFFNPGALPENITVEQLATNDYVSTPRNKQVARLFKEMGEIERYGTGIKRVCDMFVNYGLGKPEWLQMNGGVGVKVSLVAENATENATEKITDRQRAIIASMKENPYVRKEELGRIVGMHISNISRNIEKLRQHGFIRRVGPAKGGYWQVLKGG